MFEEESPIEELGEEVGDHLSGGKVVELTDCVRAVSHIMKVVNTDVHVLCAFCVVKGAIDDDLHRACVVRPIGTMSA